MIKDGSAKIGGSLGEAIASCRLDGETQIMPCWRFPVTIPLPPSTNNLFVNVRGKGRVSSKAYLAWQEVAIPILAGMPKPPTLPVVVVISITSGTGGYFDIANFEKAITDSMVKAGCIPDDSFKYVVGVYVRLHDISADGSEAVVWFDDPHEWPEIRPKPF